MPRNTRSSLPLLVAGLALLGLVSGAIWLLESGTDPIVGDTDPLLHGELPVAPAGNGRALPGPLAEPSDAQGRPRRERVVREPPPRRGPRRIIARVVDADTGDPVPAFQVTVLPASDADPLGRLEELPPQPFRPRDGIFAVDREPGRYDVVVQAPGFLPGILSGVEVPAADSNAVPIALHRGAGIAGLVVGTDGIVRPELPVFLEVLRLADPAALPPRTRVTRSGADGGFSFSPLPDGEYAVTVLEPDNTVDRIAGVRVYGRSAQVQLTLTPRHQLSLRVQDVRGIPVADARVELSGGGRVRDGKSNAAGLVVLEDIPDGAYTVRAVGTGFLELEEPVELSGGQGQHLQWLTLVPEESGR